MGELFTVKSIVDAPRISPDGTMTRVHKVTATTRSGDTFTVSIDDPDFSKDEADRQLTAAANELEAIRNL